MNLNVIGNGFDLYHGLPSSYYYFGCYLIKNNPGYFEELGKMYNLNYVYYLRTYPDFEPEYLVDDLFWSNFENCLENINEDYFLGTHDYDLGLENDDPIEIEMEEDLAAEKLKTAFASWIRDTLDKEINYEIIKTEMHKTDIFNRNDQFLLFNYTHTLQKLYKVPSSKIFYVHGECTDKDGEDLVVGHGNLVKIDELMEKLDECEKKYNFTQSAQNKIDEYKCLIRFVDRLKKDVGYCRSLCKDFYRSFSETPKTINVYGMSLGDVDMPYFIELRKAFPCSEWVFWYFSKEDRERIENIVVGHLHLEKDQYKAVEFKNELAYMIRERIIDEQEIELFQMAKNSIA